jgi:N-acyl-D-amino-acid deacylase
MNQILFLLSMCVVFLGQAKAEMPNDVESATRRGLARVKQAASDWQDNKTCFSCHHQTLPMLAALECERVGFPLDKAWLKSQADTTHRFFTRSIKTMEAGEHLAGGAGTVAFGFWALNLDQRPADQTTASMVTYMLKIQGVAQSSDRKPNAPPKLDDGAWRASCRRAPMQASLIGDTVLVLMGLEKYMTPEQRPQVAKARAAAEQWLAKAPLKEQQDRLWRLWGLHHLGGDEALKKSTLAAIFAAQRDDGGWAEADEDQSDTYSTGQTLFMLLKTGTAADHSSIIRARDYLLKTQHADGSWLAESHVKFKAQRYFENGDPYGEHQFLSTAATAWATAGLAQLLPPKPAAVGP